MVNSEYKDFVHTFHSLSGFDLSFYNQAQMYRRLMSFGQQHGCSTLKDLLDLLRVDHQLRRKCLSKLTVNVTEFYRDKEYWEQLKDNVTRLSKLPLRVWSAGCATGEEAYSLAFMLRNMFPNNGYELLASDIDTEVLSAAKAGIYKKRDLKGLEQKQLDLFFTNVDNELFQVHSRYRDKIKFFKQDLIKDLYPPNLNLILCRNVIIYFTESAKQIVFEKMAYALVPGGLLFIGASEQIRQPEQHGLQQMDTYFYIKQK